ncbi:lysophospholipid acyltransferase 2-like [Haliotis rubra]|uniref:lysophospholipid acyltransferase 2-like n=1 Tax=Haliotis rubra TaxID=36100 RepID=UPI001EE616E0|nr:lysophospholipid acyltransferase 2-like [Haliotis rubra]
MVSTGEFYAGFQLFYPLVNLTGLPIDQINFLLCQLIGLGLAIPFRKVYGPKTTSATIRHAIEIVVGFTLTFFCFGYQIWHLFFLSLVCYLIMLMGSQEWMHKAVFGFAMLYLSVTHIFRQIYDYGGYTLDITGPMMIMVQKLTSLAFSVHDGTVKSEEELSADQKSQAVRSMPGLLSFYSYLFSFHGIMCGPMAFYSDYIAFIDGRNFSEPTKPSSVNGKSDKLPEETEDIFQTDKVVLEKFCITAFIGFLMVFVTPHLYNLNGLTSAAFYEMSFLGRHIYLLVSMTFARCKYYFAWKLGETVNNAAGLGFTGFDEKGRSNWDLVNNCDIYKLETCNSLKLNMDSWNKTTMTWLRRTVYDRMPKFNTLAVFSVSAFWHGFYPGYYVCFATGALLTVAARYVRRNIRPMFLKSDSLKAFYDAVTFLFTRMANVYMCVPFAILEFVPGLKLYTSFYWWMHILSIGVIVYYTFIAPPKRRSQDKKQQ